MADIAWITGAGAGLGRAVALKLAAAGWTVAASSRTLSDLEELAAETDKAGKIIPFPLDVADRAATLATVAKIEAEVGPIHTALLCAGIYVPFGLDDFSAEKLEQVFRVNVFGVANGIEAVMPHLRKRDAGRLAVVSSLAQYRGLARTAGYGASKAALLALCETLRLQTRTTGIKVQIVVPGYIQTRMTEKSPFPLPGIISAEEAANKTIAGLDSDVFQICMPEDVVGQVRAALRMDDEEYFEMAARTPLFGGVEPQGA